MGNLMVNLMMDDSIRHELIVLIREQVKPLVKDIIIEQKENADRLATKLLNDTLFQNKLVVVIQKELQEWKHSSLRELFMDTVRAEVQRVLETQVRPTLRELVRPIIREELRVLLGGGGS